MANLLNTQSGICSYTDGINEKINTLESHRKQGKLKYNDVANAAFEFGLILAEYGDGADYSTAEAYCYWNASGNRRDPAAVHIEYDFDEPDNRNALSRAGTVHFIDINRRLVATDIFDALVSGGDLTPHGFIQACRLVGLKVNDAARRSIASRIHSFRFVNSSPGFSIYQPKRPLSKAVWGLAERLAEAVEEVKK
jgi:hypothetical protein